MTPEQTRAFIIQQLENDKSFSLKVTDELIDFIRDIDLSECEHNPSMVIERPQTSQDYIYERKLRITITPCEDYETNRNYFGTFEVETTDLPEITASGTMHNDHRSGNFYIEFDDESEGVGMEEHFDLYHSINEKGETTDLCNVIADYYHQTVTILKQHEK